MNNYQFTPTPFFKNKHLSTIWNSKIRQIALPNFKRIRITTPDQDFIDLDTLLQNNSTVSVLIHGLEGSSSSTYIRSLTHRLSNQKHDVIVINLRGCSGEHNLLPTSYHSGRTEDINTVISYIKLHYQYSNINLIGFSLGGNLALKFAGEMHNTVDKVVGVSVPCDLKASCEQIERGFNKLYNYNFVRTLKNKIKHKINTINEFGINKEELNNIKTVFHFDEIYTSRYHGYENAYDYYRKCSSKYFLENITTPTLLINALNDPFLTPECFPIDECKANLHIRFETPQYGGHVSFLHSTYDPFPYHEKLILDFLN